MRGLSTKSRQRWKRLGLFCLLLLLLTVLGNSVRKVYAKKKNAEVALERLNMQVQELKKREEALRNLSTRLTTEEGIEMELRKKFNVAGAGESVAVVVEEDQSFGDDFSESSLWQKIQNFVKNLFEE